MNDILSDFFAAPDIKSLREEILENRGIDVQAIYCQHTGGIVGTLLDSELIFALEEINSDDPEVIADDLIVRTVASMRPSIKLNKPDRLTLANLADKHPVDCMAYLVNRLNGERNTAMQRGEISFAPMLDRIMTHRHLSQLYSAGVDLKAWLHWLLELDAKVNLHDLQPPRYTLDRLNQLTRTKDGISIFGLITVDNSHAMLKEFESWVFVNLADYDRRDVELMKENQWVRGNTFTRVAAVRSFLGQPEIANRRHAEYVAKRNREALWTPEQRERAAKRLVATQKQAAFLDLLEQVLDGKIEAPAPVATPKSRNRVFTGNSLPFLQKKES